MSLFKKIQGLSKKRRKIIFWFIIIIISLTLMSWWIKNFQQKLKSFKEKEIIEQFKIPSFNEELKNIPEIKIKDLKEFEEIIKKEE